MKIAIVGSRSFDDYEYLKKTLIWFCEVETIDRIISGGAKGADTLAKRYAAEHAIPLKEHLPNWNLYGKSAGFIRNKLIVADCDELIAFWNKISNGTAHAVKLAEEFRKPVHIFWPTEDDMLEDIGIQHD